LAALSACRGLVAAQPDADYALKRAATAGTCCPSFEPCYDVAATLAGADSSGNLTGGFRFVEMLVAVAGAGSFDLVGLSFVDGAADSAEFVRASFAVVGSSQAPAVADFEGH